MGKSVLLSNWASVSEFGLLCHRAPVSCMEDRTYSSSPGTSDTAFRHNECSASKQQRELAYAVMCHEDKDSETLRIGLQQIQYR